MFIVDIIICTSARVGVTIAANGNAPAGRSPLTRISLPPAAQGPYRNFALQSTLAYCQKRYVEHVSSSSFSKCLFFVLAHTLKVYVFFCQLLARMNAGTGPRGPLGIGMALLGESFIDRVLSVTLASPCGGGGRRPRLLRRTIPGPTIVLLVENVGDSHRLQRLSECLLARGHDGRGHLVVWVASSRQPINSQPPGWREARSLCRPAKICGVHVSIGGCPCRKQADSAILNEPAFYIPDCIRVIRRRSEGNPCTSLDSDGTLGSSLIPHCLPRRLVGRVQRSAPLSVVLDVLIDECGYHIPRYI